jgi:hypothetical protein
MLTNTKILIRLENSALQSTLKATLTRSVHLYITLFLDRRKPRFSDEIIKKVEFPYNRYFKEQTGNHCQKIACKIKAYIKTIEENTQPWWAFLSHYQILDYKLRERYFFCTQK